MGGGGGGDAVSIIIEFACLSLTWHFSEVMVALPKNNAKASK